MNSSGASDDESAPPAGGGGESDLPTDAQWNEFQAEINADDSIRPLGPRDWIEPDVDEHFTPPDPQVAATDPSLALAWGGVAAGPIAVVLLLIFWRAAPAWLYQAFGVVFLAGLAYLLWRMPKDRTHDDNDGAVV